MFVAKLNGDIVRFAANARVLQRAGAPDSLVVIGYRLDLSIRVMVEYHGPGVYTLGTRNVDVTLLVGGDGVAGGYRGMAGRPGALVVAGAGGVGDILRADLHFDAEHADGGERFGPTLVVRNGFVSTPLIGPTPR